MTYKDIPTLSRMLEDVLPAYGISCEFTHRYDVRESTLKLTKNKTGETCEYGIIWDEVKNLMVAASAITQHAIDTFNRRGDTISRSDKKLPFAYDRFKNPTPHCGRYLYPNEPIPPIIPPVNTNATNPLEIKNVYFNDPVTVVLWKDGTKTIVKCQEGDTYSKEAGLALCIAKKALGNKSNFNDIFKKWIPEEKVDPSLLVKNDNESPHGCNTCKHQYEGHWGCWRCMPTFDNDYKLTGHSHWEPK